MRHAGGAGIAEPYTKNETLILETGLSQRIADRLEVTYPSWDVRRDPFKFTKVLQILGLDASTPAVVQQFGGLSADVGVLRDGFKPVLLEVKKYSDYGNFNGICGDRDKLQCLAQVAPIDGYVGVLVCQDRSTPLRDTINAMGIRLSVPLSIGDIHLSKDGGGWEWAFVCGKVTN